MIRSMRLTVGVLFPVLDDCSRCPHQWAYGGWGWGGWGATTPRGAHLREPANMQWVSARTTLTRRTASSMNADTAMRVESVRLPFKSGGEPSDTPQEETPKSPRTRRIYNEHQRRLRENPEKTARSKTAMPSMPRCPLS